MGTRGKTRIKWLAGAALVAGVLWGMGRCYEGCRINLHSDYFIERGREFGGEGYYLYCNPGSTLVPMIENLKSAAWNSRIIILEQHFLGTEAANVWWIIPAKGEELVCGNDTVLGPMSAGEKEAWLEANPPAGPLKKRNY